MSIPGGIALVLLGVVLLAAGLGRRRSVASPAISLLRALFPSWRFFEAPEGQVRLEVRTCTSSLGPYQPAIAAPERRARSVLYAPRGNMLLACHDLVDVLVDELAERGATSLAQAEQLVSYKLVQNLVQWRLRERGLRADYQFRLIRQDEQGDELLFESPVYAWG